MMYDDSVIDDVNGLWGLESTERVWRRRWQTERASLWDGALTDVSALRSCYDHVTVSLISFAALVLECFTVVRIRTL